MTAVSTATFGSLTRDNRVSYAKTSVIDMINKLGPLSLNNVSMVQEQPQEEALKNLSQDGLEVVS